MLTFRFWMIMSKALIVSNTREKIDGHNGGLLVSDAQKLREKKKKHTRGGAYKRKYKLYFHNIKKIIWRNGKFTKQRKSMLANAKCVNR